MSKNSTRKRPFGIKVIVLLQILSVLPFFLVGSLLSLRELDTPFPVLVQLELLPNSGAIPAVISGLIIAFQVVFVLGLWQLKRWAWLLLMIQLGMSMAINLWSYHLGATPYFDMMLDVATVFYLNQRDVQRAFERRRRAVESTLWTT